MLKAGEFLQNRYEIISRIGSGGMADVYKAKDHRLNRFVAVKVLKQEFKNDRAFVSKFRVEAQSAAGLSHANIVNVYDVGEDRGISFIVMELVEGITLKTYISKKGKLSVREATSIALQVAAGLEAAHNNGIVHRDVKPQNILISMDGKAKIADFGIARAASSNTISSNAMGSVHYSSPEQSRGGYSDAKSDIYSMGVTMFEMLTGRVPFDGDSTVEVALKHLQEEIESPRKFTPEIPFSTEQIVLKCTQKSPDRRYANMTELIRDLKESLVNPGGNFVVIPALDRKEKTVLLSKEEMERIKSGSLPAYDHSLNTGAARDLSESGTVTGEHRAGLPGGNYYQNSGYQELKHIQERSVYPADDYDPDYDNPEDDYDEEPVKVRRRKKRRGGSLERVITVVSIFAAVAVGLTLLALAGRALGLFGSSGRNGTGQVLTENTGSQGSQVKVPVLTGRSEADAQKLLREMNLSYRYQGESPSSEYSKGLVVGQSVAAGSAVDPNTTIGYILSSGSSETLTVPVLGEMSQAEAERTLTGMGLLVSVDTTRYSDTVPEGYVITSNPGSGSTVRAGDTVTVYVSQGQENSVVEVPDVTGHYAEEATTALNNLGLYVYATTENSDTIAEGMVISQDVPAGSPVQTGTAITITVSAGPEQDEITILDSEGTWMCNAHLNAPDSWDGEPVRITLLQNDQSTVIFEGSTTFPYILNVQGQPGVRYGTVYVDTLDAGTWEVLATTVYDGVEFTRVG